jgi:hypothetical protein
MKLVAGVLMLMAGVAAAQNGPKDVPAACGAMKTTFDASVDSGSQGLKSPPERRALVYFIQDDGLAVMGNGDQHFTIRMGMDGAWAGAAKQSSAYSVAIDPGEHHLCASVQSSLPVGKILTLAHFKAEPGKIYYFRTRFVWPYPTLSLEALDSDEGAYLVGEYPAAVWKEKK